ncbi:hypothetical protein, partial [Lactobacillus delbrueckii]
PKVVGGKLPARIGSCRANQESDGSLALFVFYCISCYLSANLYSLFICLLIIACNPLSYLLLVAYGPST